MNPRTLGSKERICDTLIVGIVRDVFGPMTFADKAMNSVDHRCRIVRSHQIGKKEILGTGKSWEDALWKAGCEIVYTTVHPQQIEKVRFRVSA